MIVIDAVIELEPLNETAVEFYPLIQERIELGERVQTAPICTMSYFLQ